jgi:putative ABC transport system permease protein
MTDLRIALRLLTRRPGFSAAIVLTLAIALGASAAIFSLLNAIILRPLPFPNADRIVAVNALVSTDDGRLTLREYRDLSRDTRAFEAWGAYYPSQYNVTGGGPPEALTCTIGSSTMFNVLEVKPILGELWPESVDFTRQYNVVLSHGLWQRRFGGRRDVIGSTIVMDGGQYRVQGVLPEGFDYPLRTDVYRAVTDYNAPHVRHYAVIARVRAGVTLADAQAELDRFAVRFEKDYPDSNAGVRLRATPLRDAYIGPARPFVWLLVGAVALLVVIACVNVTNLLLSRALMSSGESAVRLALGASHWHLVRQSVTEALVLAALGTGLGAIAARWALHGLTALVKADLPPWFEIAFDGRALLVTAAVASLTAVAVGVVPALPSARSDVERVLRQETGRSAASPRQQLARRLLLAGQAAFATILLVSAGLLVAGLQELLRIDLGFNADHLLTFRVDPPYGRYPDIRTTSEFYRRAVESLQAIPGVEAAGANRILPFSRLDLASPRVHIEGRSTGRADEEPFANLQLVDGGYFRAMQIALRRGRTFAPTDLESSTPVALVSERAAQRWWGGDDPIGRRLRIVWNQQGRGVGGGSDVWLTVVGIVGNVRFDISSGVTDESGLDLYAPNTQLFTGDSFLAVRTRTSPDAIRSQLRDAIDRIDRDQSLFDVETMTARINGSIWQHRVASAVLAVFAGVALCLAVIGTYAVTSYAVASQRREIGIRLALGSSGRTVGWLVIRRSLIPVSLGALVGVAVGAGVARELTQMIGLTTTPNLIVPASLPLLFALCAAVASYLPVRRSLRRMAVVEALRSE